MEKQKKDVLPPQHQNRQPGKESEMTPAPIYDDSVYKAGGKLTGKTAIVTGGDSGIGRAVAIAYAKEGADVAIVHLKEHDDAKLTEQAVSALNRRCIAIPADLKQDQSACAVVEQVMSEFGKIDILVNNAAVQYPQNSILDITREQMLHTFESDFFSYFFMTQAVLPHLQKGGAIINTTSITAFEGHPTLIDYSAAKGAIVSFTRSVAMSLAKLGIRMNAVAPGPVWTPLIVSSFSAEEVKKFGSDTPMGRAGQPAELAPAYVFLASSDASFISGQVLHVNGGTVIN